MNQIDEFGSIFEFLEASKKEVGGRGALVVSHETRKSLAKLATGDCDEGERRELLKLMDEKPDLVAVLVAEIKKLRNASKPS